MENKTKLSEKPNNTNGKRVYPPPTHRVSLKTSSDVRRLLSGTINDLRQQRVDPMVAGKIIYAASILMSVFEAQLIEKDIKELMEVARERYGYGCDYEKP